MATSTLTGQRLTSGEVAPQGPTPAAGPGRPVRPRPPSSGRGPSLGLHRGRLRQWLLVRGCRGHDVLEVQPVLVVDPDHPAAAGPVGARKRTLFCESAAPGRGSAAGPRRTERLVGPVSRTHASFAFGNA